MSCRMSNPLTNAVPLVGGKSPVSFNKVQIRTINQLQTADTMHLTVSIDNIPFKSVLDFSCTAKAIQITRQFLAKSRNVLEENLYKMHNVTYHNRQQMYHTCDLTMDLLTCQYGHGRGFAGTIVTKQSRYLTFVHVQTDVFHYNFLIRSRTEFLHK